MFRIITLATLLCVVFAQGCTYDWECGNVPYTVCQATAGCSTTLKGIAIDQYPNVYYATICPAGSGVNVSFKSVPLTGGAPTVLYNVPASSGQSSLSVLDGLFNSIYFQPYASGPLQRVIAGQVYSQQLRRGFGGQLNLEFEPEGQSFACTTSSSSHSSSSARNADDDEDDSDSPSLSNSESGDSTPTPTPTPSPSPTPNPEPSTPHDSIDLYDGLRELYFGFTKAIYILPVDSCGPSRLGPKADGSRSTDLFFSTVIAGVTNFYFGSTTCTNCNLPPVLFSVNQIVSDFDVSTQYIFFGTNSGLYRADLNGGNQVELYSGSVSGVRVRDDVVYFNAGSSIRSINADGTGDTRLDQVVAGQSSCQCRNGFSGSTCNECDGQVQWNNGIPSCVAVDSNGVPESCAQDYQCGNPPYTVCTAGKCECAHEGLQGASCQECSTQISWTDGHPVCL